MQDSRRILGIGKGWGGGRRYRTKGYQKLEATEGVSHQGDTALRFNNSRPERIAVAVTSATSAHEALHWRVKMRTLQAKKNCTEVPITA